VPFRETVCGLPLAASVTFNVAVREPVADGVNVTEIMHFPFAGTVPPQLLVGAKSPEFAPVTLRLMLSGVGWLLVRVTTFAALVVAIG
jgi:hypothetical protein